MVFHSKTVILKNGNEVILRSPQESDAEAVLGYLRQTSDETEFMTRYPEEIGIACEDVEKEFLKNMADSPCDMMIAGFSGEKLLIKQR